MRTLRKSSYVPKSDNRAREADHPAARRHIGRYTPKMYRPASVGYGCKAHLGLEN
jgi:hypothetical protein